MIKRFTECSVQITYLSGRVSQTAADIKVQLVHMVQEELGLSSLGERGSGTGSSTCGGLAGRLSSELPHPQQRSGAGWRGGLPLERGQVVA